MTARARRRPRVELLYDAAPVHMLIDAMDPDQLRDALRTVALYAASDADGPPIAASAALWAGLAGALGAPPPWTARRAAGGAR